VVTVTIAITIAVTVAVAVAITVSITIAFTVTVSITLAIVIAITLANPAECNVHQSRCCHHHSLLHGQPPPAFHRHLQHLLIVEYHYTKAAVDLDTLIPAQTPSSLPSYPYTISLVCVQKVMKNQCQQWH
jgi:hypothetical protein